VLSPRTRALLERYTLASRRQSHLSGDRLARETGQSVEFQDFRPYGPGDELRYVDWKVYGRTGRLYTRLYRAERSTPVHILLDTSASMALGQKGAYAGRLAQLLSYAAQGGAVRVHLFDGASSPPAYRKAHLPGLWGFIGEAPARKAGATPPTSALQTFALRTPVKGGAGLALVLSDLFDEAPLQTALVALKARGFDASFLQVMAARDLAPKEGQLELIDAESGARLFVGPDEVRAYREAVRRFLARSRAAILGAGFRYTLLTVDEDPAGLERRAFAALVQAGILVRR